MECQHSFWLTYNGRPNQIQQEIPFRMESASWQQEVDNQKVEAWRMDETHDDWSPCSDPPMGCPKESSWSTTAHKREIVESNHWLTRPLAWIRLLCAVLRESSTSWCSARCGWWWCQSARCGSSSSSSSSSSQSKSCSSKQKLSSNTKTLLA